jgi:hypothetical protein
MICLRLPGTTIETDWLAVPVDVGQKGGQAFNVAGNLAS